LGFYFGEMSFLFEFQKLLDGELLLHSFHNFGKYFDFIPVRFFDPTNINPTAINQFLYIHSLVIVRIFNNFLTELELVDEIRGDEYFSIEGLVM
jgi:hypothetical protein